MTSSLSIRNYISKDWFMEGTANKTNTPMSGVLNKALETTKPAESPYGSPRVTGTTPEGELSVTSNGAENGYANGVTL